MTKTQKWINTIIGLIIGIVASAVYIMTAEPTVSWWDCGEYIATTSKLLVGHPPGAPTFQIFGRIATLFAGGDVTKMAFCVNCMSAICSGLTIMFLYFTIVRLARKLFVKNGEMTTPRYIAMIGAALVGSLAYTFSDTFWFSAVEGEVYAMSSFFTALVFWCILKWDEEYDNPKANVNPNRWIVFIAYLVGLSIGVHLLNLLTLPAIVLIMYYKLSKEATGMGAVLSIAIMSVFLGFFCPPIWMLLIWVFISVPLFILCAKKGTLKSKAEWGVFGSLCLSVVLLGLILYGVIPQIVNLAGKFDLAFVNGMHLPFNSGTIFFFLLLFALIGWGIYAGYKKHKPILLTGTFCFLMLLIGYSTFFTLVIRSNANPTIDENNPEDAVALLAYLNREQYGSNPLFYGQSYNTRVVGSKDGKPFYVRDKEKKQYVVSNDRKDELPKYDPSGCMMFPRMWASDRSSNYIDWLNTRYNSNSASDKENRRAMARGDLPTWQRNIKFMHTYQFGYMYWRYFMWNFAGRQNDLQGRGDYMNGNWISGIPAVDNPMVGNQKDQPKAMQRPGHNTYYLLPLLLGLIGIVYQVRKDTPNAFVVFMLFVMTGLAIAFYLNMYNFQPRERDYAFAASFYAFSIWIGFGVLGIYALFEKIKNKGVQLGGAILTTVLCFALVPCVMAKQNWHDHDRSDRYTALAIAKNYLDSCAPNAILFTLGDNDTFPLWYAQEVEGYRTDVRVCNLSLLSTSWYVDQMKRKAYQSDPLPISMTWDQYKDGTRDIMYLEPANNQYVDLNAIVDYIKSPEFDNQKALLLLSSNKGYRSTGRPIPASFSLKVDKEKVIANGTVAPQDTDKIVDRLQWQMKTDNVNTYAKAYIIMMDILANNNWERPIYYASTTGSEAYLGLEDYFQLEGFAYRLVPIKNDEPNRNRYEIGRIDSDILYNNLMNVFNDHSRVDAVNNPDAPAHEAYPYLWGGFNDPTVYQSEDNTRLVPLIRSVYSRLANKLASEGKNDKALEVLNKGNELVPNDIYPYVSVMSYQYGYTQRCIFYLEDFFRLNTPEANEQGVKMANEMLDGFVDLFQWYDKADEKTLAFHGDDIFYDWIFCGAFLKTANNKDESLNARFKELKIDNMVDFSCKQAQDKIRNAMSNNMDQPAIGDAFQSIQQMLTVAQLTGNANAVAKITQFADGQISMINQASPQLATYLKEFLYGRPVVATDTNTPADAA
ncbi:MAG: DUF2723 domain-containing protein [Bacteroidales bacterium]|nr:DUF2723 domain-containing protein [Bacteroidales bacterium]